MGDLHFGEKNNNMATEKCFPKESKVRDGNTTCKNQSGYRRYLYHQGNVQTIIFEKKI